MRVIKNVLMAAVVLLLFVVVTFQFLGYNSYNRYKGLRDEARSVEAAFPELEGHLEAALRFTKNPVFYRELGRLYLEMAVADTKLGEGEKRDAFCGQAEESLRHCLERNPADAAAWYDMGRVFMLYNYPLLTYRDRGRIYFRKALELDPSDEFKNLNVLFIFLSQWQDLDEDEKRLVFERLDRMISANESFIRQLRNRWIKDFSDDALLKAILIENRNLWAKIDKFF